MQLILMFTACSCPEKLSLKQQIFQSSGAMKLPTDKAAYQVDQL